MKRILLLLVFVVSTILLNAQNPLLPSTHGLSGHQPAWINENQVQDFNLLAGWNWWSTYIDLSTNGTSMVQTAIGSDASLIKNQSNFLEYASGVWTGTMQINDNSQLYMILVNDGGSAFSLEGTALSPEEVTITAKPGWNWVGYPNSNSVSINDALANYAANHGDIFKGQNAFATYNAVTKEWITTGLTTLEPGKGYLLQSYGTATTTFNFANSAKSEDITVDKPNTTWIANPYEYPTNMTMIANVKLMDNEVRSDNYELGIFHGDECRGTTQLRYIESTNSYMAFLTIFGTAGEQLQFRLLDHSTDNVYAAHGQGITYSDNAILGSLDAPQQIEFRELLSSEETLAGMLNIYPNPMSNNQELTVTLPENHSYNSNLKVQVVNILGQVTREETMTGNTCTINGLPSGIYTVRVITENATIYNNKLIVK